MNTNGHTMPKIPGAHAFAAADLLMHYCSTRFPTDRPPHPMLDRPSFAEKVQKAIDEATADLTAQRDDLLAACEAALAYIPGSEVRNWPPGWALRAEAIKKLTAAIVLAKGQP